MGKVNEEKGRRTRQSSSKAPYTRTCKCLVHDPTLNSPLAKTSGKDLRKSDLNYLIDNNLLPKRATWVCKNCLAYSQNKLVSNTDNDVEDEKDLHENDPDTIELNEDQVELRPCVSDVIKLLRNKTLNESEKDLILSEVGKFICDDITNDTKEFSSYKNLDQLSELNVKDFLTSRPNSLVTFLRCCTNIPHTLDNASSKKQYSLCLLIEQLYFVRNNNYIGSFSFSQSLIQWCLHGSKTSIAISGSSSPSGSVTTLKNVLKSASNDCNKCPPNDVDCFFDNTQRVGKTRRVREGGVTPVNVATNVVYCQNETQSDIQSKLELKPGLWRVPFSESSDQIIAKDEQLYNNIFRPYRFAFIEKTINDVVNELSYDELSDEYKDHVTFSRVIAERQPLFRICSNCQRECLKTQSVCQNCNYDCSTIERKALYSDIPKGVESKSIINVGEIIGVNPNSKENVQTVLDALAIECGIDKQRKWVRVGSDGVPYNLILNIISNVFTCSSCGDRVDKAHTTFEKHLSEKHRLNHDGITFKLLYDFVLPIPGAGHMEINLFRALFSLTRSMFMEFLAEKLGFSSKKAREFIIGCGDHHLTWQIFQVSLYAISRELCRIYVVTCLRQNSDPSAGGFLLWVNNTKNPNIVLMYHMAFTFFLSMKCFRSGVRNNNSDYMLAGRQAAVPVMFVKRHTIYPKLICSDMSDRVSAPDEVKEYIEKHESFSSSGHFLRAEGGDYITENVNRSIKNQLPPGVPTLQSWVTASRCNGRLDKIRQKVFENTGVYESSSDRGMINVSNEVQMFRGEIRKSGWFANPEADVPLVSVTNEELHPELVNVTHNSKSNYVSFLRGNIKDQVPIFITYQDEINFNDANNWTISKLKLEILSLINNIVDEDLTLFYSNHFKKNFTNANKTSHVNLYEELAEIVKNGVQEVDAEIDTNELN